MLRRSHLVSAFIATAVTVAAMLASAEFFEQYAYFAFPLGAMLLATCVGRIGEFGQPVIKKKADALLEEFARNLGAALVA